jgi:hypothetical protein
MAAIATSGPLTVRQLRNRWKPHKDRLEAEQADQSTSIRIHRACSWLGVVERMGERPDYDQALLSQWIAFNALYGQWDKQKQEPMADRSCWRSFMDRILALDADGHVAEVLKGQREREKEREKVSGTEREKVSGTVFLLRFQCLVRAVG